MAMRDARDANLDAPTLILPALQVTRRAGALSPASPSGRVFLKLPVNALQGQGGLLCASGAHGFASSRGEPPSAWEGLRSARASPGCLDS